MTQQKWTDPIALLVWLQKTNLDTIPRNELVELFKMVDARVDKAAAMVGTEEYRAWIEPWYVLVDYVDLEGVLEWPDPNWTQLDFARVDTGQMEIFG